MEDVFTVAGIYEQIRNPDRRFWQFWKPKLVNGPELRKFRVMAVALTANGLGGWGE